MKNVIKSMVVAAALAGATITGASSAMARDEVGFYIGPGGVHVEYNTGYYYDRYHHRHYYRYPADWRRYHHPMSWYRAHPYWHHERHWYRR